MYRSIFDRLSLIASSLIVSDTRDALNRVHDLMRDMRPLVAPVGVSKTSIADLLRIAHVDRGCAHGDADCFTCADVASHLIERGLAASTASGSESASILAAARTRALRYAQSVRDRARHGGRSVRCACPTGEHVTGCVMHPLKRGRRARNSPVRANVTGTR